MVLMSLKKALCITILFPASLVFSQFDLNTFNQRVHNMLFNNPSHIGLSRTSDIGFAYKNSEGNSNNAIWMTTTVGRFMEADLSDQKKGFHGFGIVYNQVSHLSRDYGNAHLTYAYHKTVGGSRRYRKGVINLGVTNTIINSPGDITQSYGVSASYVGFSDWQWGFGGSLLNINRPESGFTDGYSSLPRILDLYFTPVGMSDGDMYVNYTMFARYVEGDKKVRTNFRGEYGFGNVGFVMAFGPDKGAGFGMDFLGEKAFNFGYQFISDAKGWTHEIRVQIGTTGGRKANKRWD